MAVDTHAWDLPALDFFHLPFESDLPQDMVRLSMPLLRWQKLVSTDRVCLVQFSFRDTEHDPVDTFPASMLTPPPISGSSSDDENVRPASSLFFMSERLTSVPGCSSLSTI